MHSVGCVERRHGAMPAWAMSAGQVLQEELAAAACFFCCLLLLLLHEGTHTRARCRVVPERIASQGNVVSNGQEARGLVYAALDGSLAKYRKPPEKLMPTECTGRISYHA